MFLFTQVAPSADAFQKFIVIDYEMAFIGGLDLCYGRWDVNSHLLADVHPGGVQNEIFPGQDFVSFPGSSLGMNNPSML